MSRKRITRIRRHSVKAGRHKGRQTLTERNRLRGILSVPLACIRERERERMYLSEKTSDAELSDCIADQRLGSQHLPPSTLYRSSLLFRSLCTLLHSVSTILIVRKYFNYPLCAESCGEKFKVIARDMKCPQRVVGHYRIIRMQRMI